MLRSLNLDGMFISLPAPEIEFNFIEFNGGELHIKLNTNIDYSIIDSVVITHRIRNGNDIMKILIAKNALELKGVKNFDLVIPYLPYARQDRYCVDGESFTLKVFTNLINSQNFNAVYILDAHSDVTPALLNNCINLSNHSYILKTFQKINDIEKKRLDEEQELLLVAPDVGSSKKIDKILSSIHYFKGVIQCTKTRDVNTGKLSNFMVLTQNLKNSPCLIVDDICDGGGTFIGIAEELKKKNAGNLYLFVTHGIFSKGTKELKKYFKGIYCTNSFSTIKDKNITQFDIQI